MQSIGIFPGTFNPIHEGHVAFALESLRACHLDKVIFIPEQSPRYKTGVPDVEVRAARMRQAISEYENKLEVVVLDQVRFTVSDTLPELHRLLGDASITLLIGTDVARGLVDWANIDQLAKEVSFAIGMRQDDTADICEAIQQRVEAKTGSSMRVTCIATAFSHVSSSQFR